ncbi:MAG: hypothetical protein JRI23_35595, partial [Deltaproteobacteria bacterium]|nr:hypothetical protein [Deltaproteobacteria bacterium]MBW2537655.1 hypothetical protein [Deltaproteobacteria bacterium]
GGGQLILLGGYQGDSPAATRALDATCIADCAPQSLPIDVPARLARCSAFGATADEALLVGSDADDEIDLDARSFGMVRTFSVRFVTEEIEEILLREPRAGAAPVATPHGLLALVGGMHRDGSPALTVELFFP